MHLIASKELLLSELGSLDLQLQGVEDLGLEPGLLLLSMVFVFVLVLELNEELEVLLVDKDSVHLELVVDESLDRRGQDAVGGLHLLEVLRALVGLDFVWVGDQRQFLVLLLYLVCSCVRR